MHRFARGALDGRSRLQKLSQTRLPYPFGVGSAQQNTSDNMSPVTDEDEVPDQVAEVLRPNTVGRHSRTKAQSTRGPDHFTVLS